MLLQRMVVNYQIFTFNFALNTLTKTVQSIEVFVTVFSAQRVGFWVIFFSTLHIFIPSRYSSNERTRQTVLFPDCLSIVTTTTARGNHKPSAARHKDVLCSWIWALSGQFWGVDRGGRSCFGVSREGRVASLSTGPQPKQVAGVAQHVGSQAPAGVPRAGTGLYGDGQA